MNRVRFQAISTAPSMSALPVRVGRVNSSVERPVLLQLYSVLVTGVFPVRVPSPSNG